MSLSSLRWVVPPIVTTLFHQSTRPLCWLDPPADIIAVFPCLVFTTQVDGGTVVNYEEEEVLKVLSL